MLNSIENLLLNKYDYKIITEEKLLENLGKPDDIGYINQMIIYKYENFQYTFNNKKLYLIAYYNDSKHVNYNSLTEFFKTNKVEWREDKKRKEMNEQLTLNIGQNLEIIIDKNTDIVYAIFFKV